MIKFGTGGWRAIIGDGFTKENIQKLTKALAMKMKAEGVEKEAVSYTHLDVYKRQIQQMGAGAFRCPLRGAEH